MARHIGQGARPVFFYGQAYMGSLDAWIVALFFRLLGESVLTVRLAQSSLYLLVVASGYAVAWKWSGRTLIAGTVGLLLAVPTVNMALYTTATLGGYNELLLLGHLLLWLGYTLAYEHPRSKWRWLLLGVCAGLGWWTHGLIIVYALPVGLLLVYRCLWSPRRDPGAKTRFHVILPDLLLAVLGFLIGSAPWWVFDFTHNHAALSTYLTNRQTGEFAGIGLPPTTPLQRGIGLLLIGLPTLIGMRFPWSPDYFLLPIGILVALIYVVAVYQLTRQKALKPGGRGLVLGILGLFLLLFIASSFGADPTGRYFLPLTLPLGIILGQAVDHWRVKWSGIRSLAALLLLALVVTYQALGQIHAATTAPGFTTQFDPVSHVPNEYDEELIRFLDSHGLEHGYTHYWVAFRLAFLSGERFQYSSALPYKAHLDYNPADNRYRPYVEAVEKAQRIAYITTQQPELDAQLEAEFRSQQVTYQQTRIGPFHIYYDFAPVIPRW